jgi:hypothetical protein
MRGIGLTRDERELLAVMAAVAMLVALVAALLT